MDWTYCEEPGERGFNVPVEARETRVVFCVRRPQEKRGIVPPVLRVGKFVRHGGFVCDGSGEYLIPGPQDGDVYAWAYEPEPAALR